MIVMKSMEMDDEDKIDFCAPIAMPCKPDFPYGLRITLTEKEFEKLNLDPTCAVYGGMVHGHFMARITSVGGEDTSNGSTCRVELQIEDLAIECEDEENEDD